jgi:hypothetical protein
MSMDTMTMKAPVSNARASTDTRHRIAIPNSRPRRIRLVGLGKGGKAILDALDTGSLQDVRVVQATNIAEAQVLLADAEMIFAVACSGDDLGLAAAVKHVARTLSVMITGILIETAAAQPELPVLRAASDMLIVSSDVNYVADMLEQLGA